MTNKTLNKNIKDSGFTLVELILVVALLSISVGVTSDILLTLIRSYNKSQVTNEIEQNANFISQKIVKELRNATAITSLGSLSGSDLTPGVDSNDISFSDQDQNIIRYVVDTNDSIIYRSFDDQSGGAVVLEPLTVNFAGGVVASCGAPNCFTLLQANPQVVRISINLAQGGGAPNKIFEGTISLEDTIVIRDTY